MKKLNKRYYVTVVTHDFYAKLRQTLSEMGFFEDREPHKLIILSDLFDRGHEALQLQDFITSLMDDDAVILVRGTMKISFRRW